MSLRGLPDWHRPRGAGAAFASFEQPGVWFAPPARLDPAASGAVVIDRYAQDRDRAGGVIRYGVHTLRWDMVNDLAAARTAVDAGDSGPVTVTPLPVDGGLVRLTGPAMLVDPHSAAPALGAAAPLDQSGVSTFVATVTLDDASTELVVDAHRRGLALIGADVVLTVRGVAARHPSTVDIDLAGLSSALLGAATEGSIEVDLLRKLLITSPTGAGVSFTSGQPGDEVGVREAAEALTDRIITRFAAPLAPPARELEALALGARLPARVTLTFGATSGLLRWDLAEPLIAPRLFALASSGVGLAEDAEPDVRDHQPPALASGWHRLLVSTTARPPWAGALLGCEIAIPPAAPFRPQSVRQTMAFSGVGEASADLRLAPLEPLSGSVTGFVIHESGEQVLGTPVPLTHEALVLRTDAFPARFLPLELSPSMAADAVTVQWFSTPGGSASGPAASARLGAGAPTTLTLVVPPEDDGMLMVHAVDPTGRTATAPPTPARPLLVDPFLFPGTGAQSVEVEVDFGASTSPGIDLEFRPDGPDDAPITQLHIARQRPRTTWTRFVPSPYATGFRWRRGDQTTWSDVVHATPGTPLLVPLDAPAPSSPESPMPKQEEVITAGLRLIPAGPTDWQFLPETPTLVTQPGGTKAVSLVEAGGSALLTVVGRLTADEDQLDRARSAVAALSGTSPAAITLRPAPLTDVRATLLLGTDGGPVQLAESTTSGAYPFDAAFQATLNPEQAAAVRGAWAGGRDLLTLRYTAALHSAEVSAPKVWTLRSSSSSSSTTTTTTTTHRSGEETSVATTGSGDSDTEEHDDLPIIQPPEMVTLDLDGADWITPHHN